MRAKKIELTQTSKDAVNLARVSFDQDNFDPNDTEMSEKDIKLIKYLANHGHWVPLAHNVVSIEEEYPECLITDFLNMVPYEISRFFSYNKQGVVGSVWSWGLFWKYCRDLINTHPRVTESYFDLCEKHLVPGLRSYTPIVRAILASDFHFPCQTYSTEQHTTYHSCMIEMPIFVARQFVKHRIDVLISEVSRRYRSEDLKFFDLDFRMKPDSSIKQGSGELHPNNQNFKDDAKSHLCKVVQLYSTMIESGVAPECARAILPQTMMVKCVVTATEAAWMNFYFLRSGYFGHPQKEIQDLARMVKDEFKFLQEYEDVLKRETTDLKEKK